MNKPYSVIEVESGSRLVLGDIHITQGIAGLQFGLDLISIVHRFACLDFGEIPAEDAEVNKEALISDARLMGSYTLEGHKIWIIRDAVSPDGEWPTVTTILLPEEY